MMEIIINPEFAMDEEVLYKYDNMVGIDKIESIRIEFISNCVYNCTYKLFNHGEFGEKELKKIMTKDNLPSTGYIELLNFIKGNNKEEEGKIK